MKYRKKAAVDAYQMTTERRDKPVVEAWPVWLQTAWDKPLGTVGALWRGHGTGLTIGTLAGPVVVPRDGWVIRGSKRELIAMSAEIFAETYEAEGPGVLATEENPIPIPEFIFTRLRQIRADKIDDQDHLELTKISLYGVWFTPVENVST